MYSVEPVDRETWWRDSEGAPSHISGLYLLWQVLSESLRAGQPRSESEAELARVTGTSEIPQPILAHLSEAQNSANELLSFLETLDEDDDSPMCMRMGVRLAAEIANALDPVKLGDVLKAEEARS